MIAPIFRKMELISRKRLTWTVEQVNKEFKCGRVPARAIIEKCISSGILSRDVDSYNRHAVKLKDYKFN